MKKLLLLALLILGCAGSISSKEKTILKENFSIPNVNQNELFNMCIKWITIPSNNLNINKFEKTKIIGGGTFTLMTEDDELLGSNQVIEFLFNIQINGNNLNITYSDYAYLNGKDGENKTLEDRDLEKTVLYLQKFTQSFKKQISNKK